MPKKILIVGEAKGAQEVIYGRPFVGAAGGELNRLLVDAGILSGSSTNLFKERDETVDITNVFNFRPPSEDNSILSICVKRKDLPNKGKDYYLPALTNGWYVAPKYLPELDRLKAEIEELKPNIVVCAGGTALWALCAKVGIDKYRGAIMESTLVPGQKCIATYHPASLFRVWNRRPMIISDLQKAKAESEKPTIDRAHREVWLEPTLDDLFDFEFKYLSNADLISFDIETPNEGISCIALAPDPYHAIVLPFEDIRKPMCCYWPTRAAEVQAWQWLKHILESDTPKLAQNGMFDIQHLALAGIFVRSFEHDTMLLHHALQPEEKKGLGVLGSLYLRDDEGAWKTMGGGAKKTTKRDN